MAGGGRQEGGGLVALPASSLPTHARLHSKLLFKRAHSSSTYIRQLQLSVAVHPSHT